MKVSIDILSSLLSCKANLHNFDKLWNALNLDDKYVIVTNKDTAVMILIKLSTDNDPFIREYVAENNKTPANILKTLSTDKNVRVRGAVAGNPSTHPDTLTVLAYDGNDYWSTIREAVARNLATPRNILKQLHCSDNIFVRECVAANPNWTNQ
jgi:hypothetical protein